MICKNCGYENSDDLSFCHNCGQKLHIICDNCGYKNENNLNFCGQCGKPIKKSNINNNTNQPISNPQKEPTYPNNQVNANQQQENIPKQQYNNNSYENQYSREPQQNQQPNNNFNQPYDNPQTQYNQQNNQYQPQQENIGISSKEKQFIGQKVVITALFTALLFETIDTLLANFYNNYFMLSYYLYNNSGLISMCICGLALGIIYTYLTRNYELKSDNTLINISISCVLTSIFIIFLELLSNSYLYNYLFFIIIAIIILLIFGYIGRYIGKQFISGDEKKEDVKVVYNRSTGNCMIKTTIIGVILIAIVTVWYDYSYLITYSWVEYNIWYHFPRHWIAYPAIGLIIGGYYSRLREKRRDNELRDFIIISTLIIVAELIVRFVTYGYYYLNTIGISINHIFLLVVFSLLGSYAYREYIDN